jgi:hypothetical protein
MTQNSADDPGRWAGHTRMSHPGKHALLVADLPSGVGPLISVVQGLLIHSDWFDAYPIEKERFSGVSRETLPIADRLSRILENSALPLHVTRPPCDRSVGTCRDYALMVCSARRGRIIGSANTGIARRRHGASETRSSTTHFEIGSRSRSTTPTFHADRSWLRAKRGANAVRDRPIQSDSAAGQSPACGFSR